jgi:hypothetical protein
MSATSFPRNGLLMTRATGGMETWKDVAGYEGLYSVSDMGRVRGPRKLLRPGADGGGYLAVNLCKDGCQVLMKVHRIVAAAFIPNPDGKREVDHINRNRQDNRFENLQWATKRENMLNTNRHNGERYGIYWVKLRGVYEVKFRVNKHIRHYGWHETLENAIQVRNDAIDELNRSDELPLQILTYLGPDRVMSDQPVS